MYISEQSVIEVFNLLNKSEIDYVLIRNIDNELPSKLKYGKDIDILVKKSELSSIKKVFKKNYYKQIKHPHKNDLYLYGTEPFQFFKNKNTEVLFDLNFQLCVRSLDAGQWIPLDHIIQESAWKNKRFVTKSSGFKYWTLSKEDEFVSHVARSIFDKRRFEQSYIVRINELLQKLDITLVEDKLKRVFFKFTPYLIHYICKGEYDSILKNYYLFKEY